jgi:hypothetical protein
MQKNRLFKSLVFIVCLFSVTILAAQNNGGGCSRAITIAPGNHRIDSMIAGAASFSGVFPFPDGAKWYKFTPLQDGLLRVSSCGQNSDTRVFLYTRNANNCDSLQWAGFNDDFCVSDTTSGDAYAANLVKLVKANTTYYVEWDNAWDTTLFTFNLAFTANPMILPNQTCATATVVSGVGSYPVDSLVGYASSGSASRANWYKFTAPRNGLLTVSSCGSTPDTRLFIHRGLCNNLTLVADSDDDCLDASGASDAQSVVEDLPVTANSVYYIEWDDAYDNDAFIFDVFFLASTGTKEPSFSGSVNIAPNPTEALVNVELNFEKEMPLTATLYNMVGQVILTENWGAVRQTTQQLDLNGIANGVYILELSDGVGKIRKRLVKQASN